LAIGWDCRKAASEAALPSEEKDEQIQEPSAENVGGLGNLENDDGGTMRDQVAGRHGCNECTRDQAFASLLNDESR
jgi:hypothetical protein